MIADQTLTVTRFAQGEWTDGVFVPGDDSTFAIRCSVQPIAGYQLESLPEGARKSARYNLYVHPDSPALRTVSVDGALTADRVTYDGRSWIVHSVANWTIHTLGARHHAYVLIAQGDEAL